MNNVFRSLISCLLGVALSCIPIQSMAQWEIVVRPGLEAVLGLAQKGDTILAATKTGVYQNTVHGLVWEKTYFLPANELGQHLFQMGDTLVLATDLQSYLSTDFGNNWDILNAPVAQLTSAFLKNGYLFVRGYEDGLYRGVFPGTDWEMVFPPIQDEPFLTAITRNDIWISDQLEGLYRSSDNGETWVLENDTIRYSYTMYAHGDTLLIQGHPDCYRTTDGGTTWTNLNNSLVGIGKMQFHDGKLFGLWSSSMKISEDLGSTWGDQLIPYAQPTELLVTGETILVADSRGLLRSEDQGEKWGYINTGLLDVPNGYFDFSHTGDYVSLRASWGHTFFLPELVPVWVTANFEDIYAFSNVTSIHGKRYAIKNKHLFKAENDITEWVRVDTLGFPTVPVNLYQAGDKIVATNTLGSIYHSSDGGITWQVGGINTFSIPAFIQDTVFAYFINSKEIQMSTDFGVNWQPITTLGLSTDFTILSQQGLKSYGSRLFLFNEKAIYMSEDYGYNWIKISQGLETLLNVTSLTDLSVPIFFPNGILCAHAGKLYFTPDYGQSWALSMEGMTPFNFLTDGLATETSVYLRLYDGIDNIIWRRNFSEFQLSNFSGKVYSDLNESGSPDTDEPGLPRFLVHSNNAGQYATSQADGNYLYAATTTSDTLCVVLPSNYYISIPPCYEVDSTSTGLDFGIYAVPDVKDLMVTLTNNAVFNRGFNNVLTLTVKNIGTTVESGTIDLLLDNKVDFLLAEPSPLTNSGDTLFAWDFTDLAPLSELTILISLNVPPSTALGTLLYFTSHVSPTEDDNNPGNNVSNLVRQEVVGSYDPNDKQVTPDVFTADSLLQQVPLTYTVRFQNTGNFPATFVVIQDTLSPYLDPATFQVLSQSHPMTWTMRGNGILTFRFDNINLPDSTSNEAGSHGFVKYMVQAKPSLLPGETIENTAHIYFDFNPPITTNTTTTTLPTPAMAKQRTWDIPAISAFPNPTLGEVRLSIPYNPTKAGLLRLLDGKGRIVYTKPTTGNASTIDISALPAGIYFIQWIIEDHLFVGKVARG